MTKTPLMVGTHRSEEWAGRVVVSKRLLAVDDEPRLLRAVEVALSDEGYEVMTARSGAEAVVRVAESVPDLVISDVRMPGMNGYHTAKALP